MTALLQASAVATDAARSWPWPVRPDRYDRRPELTDAEREALVCLGTNLRRRPGGYDAQAFHWQAVGRLLRPLDDVRSSLWCPDDGWYRRGVDDAIALILLRSVEHDRTVWAWSTEDWLALIGSSASQFAANAPGWAGKTARPYLAAYAYLLSGFTEFDRLGRFQRLPLAWRVFGKDSVDDAQQQVAHVLRGWGYQIEDDVDSRISPVLCQALLLNRSPMLHDLTTEAFHRIRQHPACPSGISVLCTGSSGRRPPSATAPRRRLRTAGGCPPSRAPPVRGPNGSNAGTPPPRCRPRSAATTAPCCRRSDAGSPPNTRR
ncbi:hypothetical protein Acsp01_90360 [Actinoplanes sp. NBRC 101535]|nr:hypothetical protein Acsp01_90360 [Actinoplanes sp. NBRC 101535]